MLNKLLVVASVAVFLLAFFVPASTVLGVGNVLFDIALLPSILSPHKPAWATSASTGSILAAFTVTYIKLGFIFAFVMTLLGAIEWAILLYQVRRQRGT